MKSIFLVLAVCMPFLLKAQSDTEKLKARYDSLRSTPCYKAMDSVKTEAAKGNYSYTLSGTLFASDLNLFCINQIQKKYQVKVMGSCTPGSYEKLCYMSAANQLTEEKYGKNFIHRAWTEATNLYLHSVSEDHPERDPIEKLRLMYRQGNLDSVRCTVRSFRKGTMKPDSVKTFYVFKDTLWQMPDSIFRVGYTIIDPLHSFDGVSIGEWIFYYANGKPLGKGKYEMGAYLICQAAGAYTSGYAFRSGPWTYWYENGQTMAEGTFTQVLNEVEYTCGPETYIEQTITNESWKYFDPKGKPQPENKFLSDKINNDF